MSTGRTPNHLSAKEPNPSKSRKIGEKSNELEKNANKSHPAWMNKFVFFSRHHSKCVDAAVEREQAHVRGRTWTDWLTDCFSLADLWNRAESYGGIHCLTLSLFFCLAPSCSLFFLLCVSSLSARLSVPLSPTLYRAPPTPLLNPTLSHSQPIPPRAQMQLPQQVCTCVLPYFVSRIQSLVRGRGPSRLSREAGMGSWDFCSAFFVGFFKGSRPSWSNSLGSDVAQHSTQSFSPNSIYHPKFFPSFNLNYETTYWLINFELNLCHNFNRSFK